MAKRKSCLAWPHRKKSWWRSLTAIHHALTALVHGHGDPDPEPSPPPRPARRPSVSYPSLLLLVSGAKSPAYLQAPLLLAAGMLLGGLVFRHPLPLPLLDSCCYAGGRAVGGVPALLRRRPAPRLLPGQDGGGESPSPLYLTTCPPSLHHVLALKLKMK